METWELKGFGFEDREQRKLFIEEANEEEETRETAPLSILISSWKNVRPF